MRKLLIAALLIVSFVARAQGDMTLFFQEIGNDVALHLEGSINTSVISDFPGTAMAAEPGSFIHGHVEIVSSSGDRGVGLRTLVQTFALTGDVFQFSNDAAMIPVGTPPPSSRFSHSLNGRPPFWFGFQDATQTLGAPGTIKDRVYLPNGYASNQFISLDFIARDRSFETLGLTVNDRWGVSFINGAGGFQSIVFHAVPEPSTLGLALLAGLALSRGVRRNFNR